MTTKQAGEDGKVYPGMRLHDWALRPGWIREVLAVLRAEDVPSSPHFRGGQAEACALHGGERFWVGKRSARGSHNHGSHR